jgi:hypothetical protein
MPVDPSLQTTPVRTVRRGWARLQTSLAPALLLLLGVWICLESLQLPFGGFRMPGAGFFPLLLGILLSCLSLGLLGLHLFGTRNDTPPVPPARPQVFWLMGAMGAAAWLFERAGYLLTMVLFLGVILKVLTGQS